MSLTAAGLAWYGYRRWVANDRAIAQDRALDYPRLFVLLSGGLGACIVVTLWVMVAS
ncbi:hypothetical protein D3C78_1629950 [compost metagenome]